MDKDSKQQQTLPFQHPVCQIKPVYLEVDLELSATLITPSFKLSHQTI